MPHIAVIIVTYNSAPFLPKAIACLRAQTLPAACVIIVDTGSKDTQYLQPYAHDSKICLIEAPRDSGFCRGNNIGYAHVPASCDYVFFLNPDAFIAPDFLEKAAATLTAQPQERWGAVTGITLGYDMQSDAPTGRYDTTGVFQKWYGKWYDRAQGQACQQGQFLQKEVVPAICGAVFFCLKAALDEVLLAPATVFNPAFFMYKEDIDLSLRLRHKGWQLGFDPALIAYHCRGWQQNRRAMPRQLRLCAARNELKLHADRRWGLPLFYSALKYGAVKLFNA